MSDRNPLIPAQSPGQGIRSPIAVGGRPGSPLSRGRAESKRGTFAPIQKAFAAALLDPERPVPGMLTAHTGRTPAKRFAVYRNNVVVSLVDALGRRFPATQRIVGEAFFRDMARVYVAAHPPRDQLLMFYGDDFPGFITAFEPVQALEYLPDVARLEAARTRAYHAADARPLDPKQLGEMLSAHSRASGNPALGPPFRGDERNIESPVDDSVLGGLRFLRHPSAEIVRSRYPIVTIWAMNSGELELGEIKDWRGEDALVTRPALDVLVHRLPAGGAVFLAALFGGATLAAAAEAAQDDNSEFDLTANLAGLISAGAAADVRAGHEREPST